MARANIVCFCSYTSMTLVMYECVQFGRKERNTEEFVAGLLSFTKSGAES